MERDFFKKQFSNYYRDGYNGWMMSVKASHKYRFWWAIKKLKEQKTRVNYSLELGCASGDFTEYMLHNIGDIVELRCVDLCEEAIDICKERIKRRNVHFEVCELPNIDYASNRFDTVWCMDVIYYMDIKQQYKLVYEINRMLTEDGIVLFMIPYDERNCSILKRCVKKYMTIIDMEYNYNALWGTWTSFLERIYKRLHNHKDMFSTILSKLCISIMSSEMLMNIVRIINTKYFKDKKSHMMIIAKKGKREGDFE